MESQNENEDEYSCRKSPTNTTTKPRRIMKMEHSTTDFYLSCYFAMCGHIVKDIRVVDDNNRMEFVFENSNDLQKLKEQYFWDKALVNPILYKDSIRKMKTMLYNY